MDPFGVLLGVAAIGVIGAGIAFLCNELSEEEKSRQQKMRREYEEYENRRREEYQNTCRHLERARRQEERRYQEQLQAYQKKMLQRRKRENQGAFQQMLELCDLQYSEKEELLKNCRKIVQDCEKSIQAQQHSNARFNSMKSTFLSLQEAVFKLEAYLRYMDHYREELESVFEESGELPAPFSMTLPEDYPYEGKVFCLEKDDFCNHGYSFGSAGRIWLDKTNNELFDNSRGRLPFMVYTAPNGRQYLSLTKGKLKSSIGGTIGLDMEVTTVYSSKIYLQLARDPHLRVTLFKRDLNGRNRRTPFGSSLHVFVKDYDFALQKPVIVSERAEDGMSIAQFDKILMVQTKEECRELYQYAKENNLLEESSEWRIGPRMDERQNLTGLILQKGMLYALRIAFEEVEGGGLVLRYQGRLPEKEFLTFDDAFVSTDVSVQCCFQESVWGNPGAYQAYFEECQKLRLYLTREFAVQRQILARSPMSVYLDQWLEVTNRLIKYRDYGGHIRLKIDEWQQGMIRHSGTYTMLHVDEEEEHRFQKFQEREARNGRNRFFLELSGENGGRCGCRIIPDEEGGGVWLCAQGEIDEQALLKQEFTLDLYSKGNAYTERQQASAIQLFKEGQVASEMVKAAIINTGAYQYADSGHRVTPLFNKNIQANPSQTDAVTRAFSEKNFFLIQGPPGTGKTTVIKELILQQLSLDPTARIIVVSQANVAVDNVLRGIVKLDRQKANIVRCGSEERIADDLEEYSFDCKFSSYKQDLRIKLPEDPKARTLREKWLQIIEDKGNADLVGECLLGCFQIIGATCLGLENRHYGLSGMEFDLVVIDEAGKALAGELLIPINRAKKVIIIGDHLQLPPVVDPELYKGGDVQYDDVVDQKQQDEFTKRSFFQRLYEDCPDASKCMLNIQFRMPPDIAELVSTFFYDGALETGANCLRKKPIFLGHHLIFVDMKDEPDYREKQERYQDGGKSGPYNEKELEAAAAVVRRIRTCFAERIVIITPYKKQKKLLVQYLKQENLLGNVSVNTIDAFQGDEADVVIYCTTRARHTTDYFSDAARLNVAFSRARNTLIFLASSAYLRRYPKGHILQDIGDYLAEQAAVVPYAQWSEVDLQYNAGFSGGGDESAPATELCSLKNDFFQSLVREDTPVRTCLACGQPLSADEDGLCAECLVKVEDKHRCKCCHKPILLSYYDKYIHGASAPELCSDCRDAHFEEIICERCGKKFYIQHEQREELLWDQREVLCPGCEKYVKRPVQVGSCRHCARPIYLLRGEVEQLKKQGKHMPVVCPDCEKMCTALTTVGYCRHCRGKIEIPWEKKWNLEVKGLPMPVYCEVCDRKRNEEALIGFCHVCGNGIKMKYQKKWQYEEEGKRLPTLCLECGKRSREKVKAGRSQICGRPILISRLKFEENPYRDYDLCSECRNEVVDRKICVECNEWFEITLGEMISFEKKGLNLPKRCKKCRKAR